MLFDHYNTTSRMRRGLSLTCDAGPSIRRYCRLPNQGGMDELETGNKEGLAGFCGYCIGFNCRGSVPLPVACGRVSSGNSIREVNGSLRCRAGAGDGDCAARAVKQ